MAKFKCPYCGGTQNTDGICKNCDIGRVQPVTDSLHYAMPGKTITKLLVLVCLAVILWKPITIIIEEGYTGQYNSSKDSFVVETTLDRKWQYIELAKETAELSPTSYQRILDALISSGLSEEDARYGLDNCGVDWNNQALRAIEWCKEQGDYADSLMENWLIEQELFTADQAKAGMELYRNAHGLEAPKVLEYYGTTTVEYIGTVIRTLDSGDYEIVSTFMISSTEKCALDFGVQYLNDYKEPLDSVCTTVYRKIELGDSILTVVTEVPSIWWYETPTYLAMSKSRKYYNRDDIVSIVWLDEM